jgi:hypothetical protein
MNIFIHIVPLLADSGSIDAGFKLIAPMCTGRTDFRRI